MSSTWYVDYPDRQVGPLSRDELRELVRRGHVDGGDRVSSDRADWKTAAEISDLSLELASRTIPDHNGDTTKPGLPDYGPDALEPGHKLPGHEILSILGSGAMGLVYCARQNALNRIVALKTVQLSRQHLKKADVRFEQEAQAVARLRHPNIVTAYDFGRHETLLYFTMELLDGETLEARLRRDPLCDEAYTWGVIRQAAAGLAHAAAEGVIHRDVKPGNLFLTPPPTGFPLPEGLPLVKVTDFGLALVSSDQTDEAERLAAAGTIVGTPLYMAPEQYNGNASDLRADIYSLGITAYEMLAGQPAFTGNLWEIMQQKLGDEFPARQSISPESYALIRDMTAQNSEQRIATYESLIGRIDSLQPSAGLGVRRTEFRGTGVVSEHAVEIRPAKPPSNRTRIIAVAVGFLTTMLLFAGMGWIMLWPVDPGPPPLYAAWQTIPLFRGTLFRDWQTLEGSWSHKPEDSGNVLLVGRGTIRRSTPDVKNFIFHCGVDFHESNAVELHFAIEAKQYDGRQPRFVLRATREHGVALGRKAGDNAPFERIAMGQTARLADGEPGVPLYREMKLLRIGSRWWVSFAGLRIGSVHDPRAKLLPEIRIVAEDGPAQFNGIELIAIEPELLPDG